MDLSPHALKRRLEIGRLLVKYGRRDLVQIVGLDEGALREESGVECSADPEDFARDLERLGPTFVKGGQLLSTRPDLLAQPYLDALSRLQDDVEAFSFAEVEAIVEEELGVRMSRAFASFESTPLAAGSLSQVHAARMRDGREVVVKVQRPSIREEILADLEVLDGLVSFAAEHSDVGRRYGLDLVFEQFRRTMVRELDFTREVRNLERIRTLLEGYPELVVPAPVPGYSTSRVLTMERVHGRNVGKLTGLSKLDMDGERLAESLVKGYLDLILVHGVFNADPHPGNLLATDDGRLAIIDMGMVAYLSAQARHRVLRLLLAVGEADPDTSANIIIEAGERLEDFDEAAFKRAAADLLLSNQDANFADINFGRLVLEMIRLAGHSGLRPPPDLTMLGKTLLNLDEATRILAPDLRPADLIRDHSASLMRRHLLGQISPGNLFGTALAMSDLVQRLPERVNTILDRLSQRDLELKVRTIDEERLISGLQKIANRITMGLVIAALIVGAALLMSVPTEFEVFGYPGLAILCFLAASTVGVGLLGSIVLSDRKG